MKDIRILANENSEMTNDVVAIQTNIVTKQQY
jgi:hypothetical protein